MKFNDYSNSNMVILFILALALLAIIPIYVHKTSPSLSRSSDIDINVSMPLHREADRSDIPLRFPAKNSGTSTRTKCNLFEGNWVPNLDMPYYTNETKCVIDNRQNCMKFGRPDSDYMKWRWKPTGCELPLFDAAKFLEHVRGKSMAFVGDSVARNQMQSLICLLTSVRRPLDVSHMMEEPAEHYFYSEYNFTLALIWSTHLVGANLAPNPYNKSPANLTLDLPESSWWPEIEGYDFVIVSSGHWFLKPLRFYEKGKFVGCHICRKEHATELNVYYAYRMAFRTVFRMLLTLPKFKGTVFMRTVTGSHVDHGGGSWTEDGDCTWTRPFRREEARTDEVISEMYSIQVEEFRAAEREGRKKGLKFGLLDISEAMSLRPDGHPNRYGHWPHEKIRRPDCLHWCLPGPIDIWNEILLHMMMN
ncbi:protein trichome birefringence-like 19 [Rhododendron vialii]|uniref:protein trichome birefringence-like 19 n=1 Tax=Rhododendron vialii TaxID=182163 RepID=UPI00265E125B|nr:protein trichome birefringence-like 19 [Rhododendron vialii]